MTARHGGSYQIDKNGKPQLVERTAPAVEPKPATAKPAPNKGVK